jgi:adenine-specific DNA glycosylase
MSEEDLKACMQCTQLRESLEPCEGGCGKEICSYCGPKCKECIDQETYDQIREEKEEEKRQKREAKKPKWEPERSTGEKVWRAMDWLFGMADGTLRRELEHYEGEFEQYSFEDVQEMMRSRWKGLPDWKKKLYKIKKKTEDTAMKTVYKVGTKGGRIIGRLGHPPGRKDYDDDYDDDDGKYF